MAQLKIENVPVGQLKPYSGNAKKHPAEQIEQIAKSIQEFGFNDPIAVWHDEIVEGHGRLLAALHLGLKKVPVIRLDDLTDAQRRAYTLVHNKLTMDTGFDMELLRIELSDLEELDMEQYGFELPELDIDDGYYGDERERTFRSTNFDEYDESRTEGFYDMPILRPVDYIPTKLVGFNYAKTSTEYDSCIHFYLDDYQFERIWNEPQKYIAMLKRFDAVMTPNFSIYLDYPESVKIWNTYRARLLGQMMQDAGITVVPIVYWSTEKSWSYCFDGLPSNGTLSINNIGNSTDESKELWSAGVKELIRRKSPKRIILYSNGVDPDFDFGDIEVLHFTNAVIERMQKN